MKQIEEQLFALQDKGYAAFQAKLTPGIPAERFIGVRVPALRVFAKEFIKNPAHVDFLGCLPHPYYDEDMLHGLLLSQMKDFAVCVAAVDRFLPFVDNWAVCDIMSPKVFGRHRAELLPKIEEWSRSEHTYTCRFGLEMLMTHFLDADFRPELLQIPLQVLPSGREGEERDYYVRMMVAWFFATSLAKQWEATIPIIERRLLPAWTHNKTIQKARESFRITDQQKTYLNTLKMLKNGRF